MHLLVLLSECLTDCWMEDARSSFILCFNSSIIKLLCCLRIPSSEALNSLWTVDRVNENVQSIYPFLSHIPRCPVFTSFSTISSSFYLSSLQSSILSIFFFSYPSSSLLVLYHLIFLLYFWGPVRDIT